MTVSVRQPTGCSIPQSFCVDAPGRLLFVLTVGRGLEARPPVLVAAQAGQTGLDQLPVHEAAAQSRVSVRVDVGHRVAGHLSVLIHLPKHTAPVLDAPQYTPTRTIATLTEVIQPLYVCVVHAWSQHVLKGISNRNQSSGHLLSVYFIPSILPTAAC